MKKLWDIIVFLLETVPVMIMVIVTSFAAFIYLVCRGASTRAMAFMKLLEE